ncbi:ABC transporter permease subunit [Planococcus shixiaomingii]|uniref:ABC transporter permease subunit n=1 Tax=Planococcus shixiaomingii TaxID=3058393 RepID=UPI0026292D72|nr:ABC transporter permease subunit [Planococcus sp. N022]WKA56614.1 ABC transporter permease subunit [Planococcus sp. N022]
MKKLLMVVLNLLFGFIGIVLISSAPALFKGVNFFDFHSYGASLAETFTAIANPAEWVLTSDNLATLEPVSISFSQFLSGPYLYSMPILLMSLVLSFISAFLLALFTLLSTGPIKRMLLRFSKILQSFPDFSYVFLIQIIVLYFFAKIGVLLLNFYSLGDERVYLAPVLCLSVLPTLLLYKLFVTLYEEEEKQLYVELARSKGLSRLETIWKHCTPNVLKSVFYQSKSIVWLTLSSLVIIEYLFGIDGILYYLQSDFSSKGIAFILLAVFIPFFFMYAVVELLLKKGAIERNALFEKFNLHWFDSQEIQSSSRQFFTKDKKKSQPIALHLKNRLNLIIPSAVVLGLLLASLLYAAFTGDHVEQVNYIYNEEGGIESSAPHPPSSFAIFGTDPYGYSIAQQLLVGLKYTIVLSLVIATLRIFLGYVFGILYAFFLNTKARSLVNSLADGMHFLPLTLLVFILLVPVLISSGEWHSTLWERITFQILIMSAVVLPITASAIGNEMNESLKKEFVVSSVLMGGSLSWILAKHIQPQLWPKLVLMWVQHMVQVLQMFVHLGILSIFVGGALSQMDSPRLIPEIYELSGMIAISREVFVTKQYWMIVPPFLIFMILIYCFSTIAEHLISQKEVPLKKPKAQKPQENQSLAASFTRVGNAKFSDDAN